MLFKSLDNQVDRLLIAIYATFARGRFGIKEKIFFFRELAYLLEGGIGIVEAIDVINKNTSNLAIKEVTEQLYKFLNAWEAFNRSLLRLKKYFNDVDVAIIRWGEESGELIKVMKFLADEYEFLLDVKQKYVGALIYPFILLLAWVGAIYVIFAIVMPSLMGILDSFWATEVGGVTQFLISMVDFFRGYGWVILISVIFWAFLLGVFIAFPQGKRWWDATLLSMPIIGDLQKRYLLVKFMRYFSLFLKAGLNYKDIFKGLRWVMNNSIYEDMFDESLEEINKGGDFVEVFANYPQIIPPDIVVLLKVGEKTASIPKALDNAIVLYEGEFKKLIDNFSKVIEPVMILVIGGIVGLVAFAVFGIIGSILDSLQGF